MIAIRGLRRATRLVTLAVVLSVAFWPSLLLPLARQYVEFNFHHPGATPFIGALTIRSMMACLRG